MVDVSAAWKEIHQGDLLPETFVEITCAITEAGAQETATSRGENEATISNAAVVAGNSSMTATPKYATLEQNLWSLDGTRSVAPNNGPYQNAGYVSADDSVGRVTLSFSTLRRATVSGVTIVWSSEFDEYPTRFSVTVKNGNTVIASKVVENNASSTSLVDLEISNYNTVVVEAFDWCLPNRRFRVERIYVGHIMTFTKNELLSYTHEQSGNLNSAELPKNSIEFSVDNRDGRWNPNNPNGLERYLSERQRVTVRYGMSVNGSVEWIKGGTFFLSEWRAPANGMEASFIARDILEFLMYEEFPSVGESALIDVLEYAYSNGSPEIVNTQMVIDPIITRYDTEVAEGYTRAEVVQMCANAACCVVRTDRNGVLHVEPLDETPSGYVIPASLSYSYPETTLSKPLKEVSVSYGWGEDNRQRAILPVGSVGEIQTVDNPLVTIQEQATFIALWVQNTLESRKTVSGDFRGDPRLDLFDIVEVEGKYGTIGPVAIESIKYTYSGSFNATYTGRVITSDTEISPLGV